MRDSAHAIYQTQSEKLEKVKLEGGWSPTLAEIKYGEVLVVVIFKQVCNYAKEVEKVDLQETLVDMRAEAL